MNIIPNELIWEIFKISKPREIFKLITCFKKCFYIFKKNKRSLFQINLEIHSRYLYPIIGRIFWLVIRLNNYEINNLHFLNKNKKIKHVLAKSDRVRERYRYSCFLNEKNEKILVAQRALNIFDEYKQEKYIDFIDDFVKVLKKYFDLNIKEIWTGVFRF